MNRFTSDPFDSLGFRVSYARKKANDYEYIKELADYYDHFYTPLQVKEERNRLRINYDLYNGRNPALDDYKTVFSQYNFGDEAKYTEALAHYDQIEHHPIIDQIAKAMVGERRRRKINARVKDISFNARNQRKAKKVELIKQLFTTTVIDPIRMEVLESMNIDPEQLTPQMREEIQRQVEQQVQTMLLEEIKVYMENDFYLATDVQGQRMLEYWMKINDIENLTVEGFKHAIISGKEIYRHGIRNYKPFAEFCNPMHINYYLSPTKNNIEDAEWVSYEQYITVGEFFDMFGSEVKPKDLKKLDAQVKRGTNGNGRNDRLESQLVATISHDPNVLQGKVDQRNAGGQEYLRRVFGNVGQSAGYLKLRHVHICFKTQRMMYYVYRPDPETGNLRWEWMDESYTPNKMAGDIKWKTTWVNQIWELDKIGDGAEAIYLNIRPLKGQYNSPDDPFNPKMPYVGSEYSRLMCNTRNVAVMDLGKPWQYKFNVQMARLQEIEATDLGKVLLMVQNAMPKDWDPIDFYGYIKNYKLGILDTQQEGFNPNDAQLIKGVDLSNSNEIANKIQYLEFLKDNIAKSMYYNPSRLGQISPYLPVTNNQQNILQSSAQTEDIYSIHNNITERLLNALVDDARIAYYENPEAYTYILDEVSMADLQIEPDLLKNAKLGVTVSNQSEDEINLQTVREFIPYMIQNELIDFEDLTMLIWAKNGSEVLNLAKKGDKKKLQRAEAEQAQAQQMAQAQQQHDEMMFERQRELEIIKQGIQHDVDKNNLNDKVDREDHKAMASAAEKAKDRALMRELEMMRMRLEEKKIAAQERMNRFKSNTPRKK